MSDTKPSSDPSPRTGTRDRLVDAAIRLLRGGGVQAVTTPRLAAEVGIVQSGFYRHFKSTDECLRAAASRIGGRVRRVVLEDRMLSAIADADDPVRLAAHFARMLELMHAEWGFLELLLRFRQAPGPVGEALGWIHGDLVADLERHFERVAARHGVSLAPEGNRELSEWVLAAVMSAGERYAASDGADRDGTAARLTAFILAGAAAVLGTLPPSTGRR